MRELPFLPLFLVSLGPCLASVVYLYFYPLFLGCQFPSPQSVAVDVHHHHQLHNSTASQHRNGSYPHDQLAPFRLLVLADPQLEGDTSLPHPDDPLFPTWHVAKQEYKSNRLTLSRIGTHLHELVVDDVGRLLYSVRKRIDLVGNDYYLGHVYTTMNRWANPTHTTVLGDLLGSQWISDPEFDRRSDRYWNRVFRHATAANTTHLSRIDDKTGDLERTEELGADPGWSNRLIHVVGNHDVGYAGDMTEHRVSRFERRFGPVNGAVTFNLSHKHLVESGNEALIRAGVTPTIRLVVLNSMNLDTPALSPSLQDETYRFLNAVIRTSKPHTSATDAVVLLTHIPLYKPEGVCTDAPMFTFFHDRAGGIREQNHLSDYASWGHVLRGIFGMRLDPVVDEKKTVVEWKAEGRKGLVLTGHDHTGCDVLHFFRPDGRKPVSDDKPDSNSETNESPSPSSSSSSTTTEIPSPTFHALRTPFPTPATPPPSFDSSTFPRYTPSPLREITVRSMMGEYGGNAVLVSAWIDPSTGSWRFESTTCAVGTHHVWWIVHVSALIVAGLGLAALVQRCVVVVVGSARPDGRRREKKKANLTG